MRCASVKNLTIGPPGVSQVRCSWQHLVRLQSLRLSCGTPRCQQQANTCPLFERTIEGILQHIRAIPQHFVDWGSTTDLESSLVESDCERSALLTLLHSHGVQQIHIHGSTVGFHQRTLLQTVQVTHSCMSARRKVCPDQNPYHNIKSMSHVLLA